MIFIRSVLSKYVAVTKSLCMLSQDNPIKKCIASNMQIAERIVKTAVRGTQEYCKRYLEQQEFEKSSVQLTILKDL